MKRKRPVTITNALCQGSSLRAGVRRNLGALIKRDLHLIEERERVRVADSLDLDSATTAECPNANRWDYLLSVPDAGRVVGLEPHSAGDSDIKVVIRKKQWAEVYLRGHLRQEHRVSRWYWVSHGRVTFSRMERARRELDGNGIEFVGRTLRSLA